MSRLEDSEPESCQWFMSIFALATFNVSGGGGENNVRFFLIERHIELTLVEPLLLSSVFLFEEWLVVPLKDANQLVWFDKSGKRSETSTKLNNISNLLAIYSSDSSLLFAVEKDKLLLKQQ